MDDSNSVKAIIVVNKLIPWRDLTPPGGKGIGLRLALLQGVLFCKTHLAAPKNVTKEGQNLALGVHVWKHPLFKDYPILMLNCLELFLYLIAV